MAGTPTSYSIEEMRRMLTDGSIVEVTGRAQAANCSRCGNAYSGHDAIPNPHSFRTQPSTGIRIQGYERGDGLVYIDGRTD